MWISPGTYAVTKVGESNLALIEYNQDNQLMFGCYRQANSSQHHQYQWYFKPSCSGLGYVLQNVWSKSYLELNSEGQQKVDFYGATIWSLGHGHNNSYTLSVQGTNLQMRIAYPNEEYCYIGLVEANETDNEVYLWKFEKLSDDAGELPPLLPVPRAVPEITDYSLINPRPNNATSMDTSSPYPDNEHCYTDALFNMPRTPFGYAQRLLALDWARKLGATNVPTIESFEECERGLEGRSDWNLGATAIPQRRQGPPYIHNNAVLNEPAGPYKDRAHLYTDMLFNMPRTPFTRTQRIAALDWARQLGATKIPTMESFDECERGLDAEQSNANNLGRHSEFDSEGSVCWQNMNAYILE